MTVPTDPASDPQTGMCGECNTIGGHQSWCSIPRTNARLDRIEAHLGITDVVPEPHDPRKARRKQ